MEHQTLLNAFVRFIALLERVGNALGTLAFIWGTVVVLGGFATFLGQDFWVATVIVFLEGFRTFSRQSSSDDRLLFKTTGGIKLKRMELGTNSGSLYYVNAVIMTATYKLHSPWRLARIMISSVWLFWNEIEIYDTENENVKLAVKILYIMVMCQGILYILACILESLSFLLRRSLALECGLVDKSGMRSIDLYYEQAYDTFLQESVFDTTNKMSLVTFAVDFLNPKSSRDNKSAAVRILDSFMQRWNKTYDICNTKLISLITTSPKAVTTLINMLGWTVTEDADIRLFAAKVTAHLAPHVQIIRIPGTMQMVSSLLDAQDGILVQIVDGNGGNADDDQQVSNGASSRTVNGNASDIEDRQQMGHGSSNSPLDIEGGNMPAVQASSTPATQNNSEGCSVMERICRFLGYVQKLWSIPQEDTKDEDSLPALGMNILEGLAHDLHNCEEISRTTELLPKIIGFISYIPGPTTSHQEEIATSSLKLVGKLASVKGEIGIKLRRQLSDNPFLIGNLAEILEDEGNSSYLEQSKLAMYIITNIAMDKKTRQEIGMVQVIIDRLVQKFIGEEELSNPLRAEAGQALAMLAIESPNNCSAMLYKTSELIGDLANKLQRGVHVYQAASLLQSLCKNSRQLVLSHQCSDDRLLSTMTVVLGRIKDAEGKQMEALIGLASQICSVMSERIAPVLDSFSDDEAFVDKLVGELNARKKPSPHEFPETRSLLVELTVSIVEFCPHYAPIFKEHRMVEALSKVERYTGEVSGEARALRAMVATAKRLIGVDTPNRVSFQMSSSRNTFQFAKRRSMFSSTGLDYQQTVEAAGVTGCSFRMSMGIQMGGKQCNGSNLKLDYSALPVSHGGSLLNSYTCKPWL
uniref:Uncharacterized protein n=1 Tax=Aegilops tauschii TaxID=37682 RepID=M8C3Q9_AEGTA